MKTTLFVAQICLLIALGAVSGVVHGRLTNRWGAPADIKAAADVLAEPPQVCGEWKLARTEEIEDSTIRQLQCPGYLNAVYERERPGGSRDVVRVAVLVGPPGPIAVHTPEVCYSNADYEISNDRKPAIIDAAPTGDRSKSASAKSDSAKSASAKPASAKPAKSAAEAQNEFWYVTLKSRGVDAFSLRVYYGWSTAGDWRASKRPRFEYAGQPYLYKLQAAAVLPPTLSGEEAPDPCREFLVDFLPAIQDRLSR
jgi:hypothetical protein